MGRPPNAKPPLSQEEFQRAREIVDDWARVIQTLDRLDENERDLRAGVDVGDDLDNAFEAELRLNAWRRDDLLAAVLNATRGREGVWEFIGQAAAHAGIEDVVNSIERLRGAPSGSARVSALRDHDRDRVVQSIRMLQVVLKQRPTSESQLSAQLQTLMATPPEPDPSRRGGAVSDACAIVAKFISWHAHSVEKVVRERRRDHGADGVT